MTPEICRVLLVDDDEDNYIVTRDFLSEAERVAFTLNWVDNYEAGLAAIKNSEHDVYLLDFRLGKENGEAALEFLHNPENIKSALLLLDLNRPRMNS